MEESVQVQELRAEIVEKQRVISNQTDIIRTLKSELKIARALRDEYRDILQFLNGRKESRGW